MENIYTIWKNVYQKLEYMLAAKIRDTEVRKDLLHDIFLKIHSGVDSLKSTEKLLPWVRQITRNVIADHYRASKKNIFVSEVPDIPYESEDYLNDRIISCMMPMIEQLGPRYREAILLSELKGVKQREIAEQLDISFSGVKSRVQRGRKKLKNMIQQCCEIEADVYGNIVDYTKRRECATDCTSSKR